MAARQVPQTRFWFPRKAGGESDDRAERAGLAVDGCLGTIDVVPDLGSNESNEQAKDDTQGGQQAGGDAFEHAGPLPSGELHDEGENSPRGQVRKGEYPEDHPAKRKVLKPYTHLDRLIMKENRSAMQQPAG